MHAGYSNMKLQYLIGSLIVSSACTLAGVETHPVGHTGTGNADVDGGTGTDVSANCNAAQGPEHPYTMVSELEQLVLGQWIHCSGPTLLDNEQLGVEFDADGTYHMLAGDGDGGITVLNGFGNQGTWDAAQEGATAVQWDIHPDPNSGNGGYPTFEDSPRMFALEARRGIGLLDLRDRGAVDLFAVIWLAAHDLERAIELLEHEHADEAMRDRHPAEREQLGRPRA